MKSRQLPGLVLLLSLAAIPSFAQTNKALQSELLKMGEEDQKVRASLHKVKLPPELTMGEEDHEAKLPPELLNNSWELLETDRRNMKRLEEIIQEHGWPGKSLVGEEAAVAAFLILQHAEPDVLAKYFPLLKEAAAKGEARPQDAAMMEDRNLMYQGKKQIYGTQISNKEPYPIEDEENVDARRASVGLGPMAEYLRYFGLTYKPPVKN